MMVARTTVFAVAAISAVCLAPHAGADDDVAINGTFTAFSDGQWAETNDSYHDEVSVTQTWTITSTCTTIPNWEPCADGTSHPGKQSYTFWLDYPQDRNQYLGWDRTEGPSGGCGFNKVLDVEMPFRLTRLG
jgi:hypothetical protein